MLIAEFKQYFFGIAIFVTSLFLIMLVLVQRGRGGGLTGALGGSGGQSAFGTKAGDLFTRITIGVAAVWIFLCAAAVLFLKVPEVPKFSGSSSAKSGMGGTDDAGDGNSSGTTGLSLPPLNAGGDAATGAAGSEVQAEIAEFPDVEGGQGDAESETDESTPTSDTTNRDN